MARNGNGNDSHYAAVDRSDIPQGRKENIGEPYRIFWLAFAQLNDEQAVKIALSNWREDAEHSLGVESVNARKNSGANVERRETSLRLARQFT